MIPGLLTYLLIVGCALVFRLAYLGWFGPYLLSAVILLPPLYLALSLPSMLGVSLSIQAPDPIRRKTSGEMIVQFQTRRHRPVGKIRLRLRYENLHTGRVLRSNYLFDAVGVCEARLPLPTDDCGVMLLSVEDMRCSDCFGLFSLRRRCPDVVRCCVLPDPQQPDSAVTLQKPADQSIRLKPKYGGGFAEDHEMRPYRPGDSINAIHWKLSAKTEDLIVREPMVPDNDKIYLVLEQAGPDDRGLQSLCWLSEQLCDMEVPHVIVSRDLFPVSDEIGMQAALRQILAEPPQPPAPLTYSDARLIYRIRGGEVSMQ